MAATAFAFHNLPDDIIHAVVGEWLFDKDSCWDNLRLLSVIDKVYSNHSLRPLMLNAMAGFEVSVEEFSISISYHGNAPFDRQSLFKWIEARKFKVGTVGLYQREGSTSRALTQRQRLPPMRDVHTISIDGVDVLKDLNTPVIATAIRSASDLKNIHLNGSFCRESCARVSKSAQDVLSRVTHLTTRAPSVLSLMKSMTPTLREVNVADQNGFQHLDLSVWQSEMFSQVEKLTIDQFRRNPWHHYDEEEKDMDNDNIRMLSRHVEHLDHAHLPKLTRLSLSIEGDSASRIVLHQFIRGAPLLTHLEIKNFSTWTKELSMDLFTHPPPQLRSLILEWEMVEFNMVATTNGRFLPLPADAYIALPADDNDEYAPINELYLNAVLFVAQDPSVIINLVLRHPSSYLLNSLPWPALSRGQLPSFRVEVNDFRLTKETWINMIMTPTSNLDVTLRFNHSSTCAKAELKVCMEALKEIQASGRTSTITNLAWEIMTGMDVVYIEDTKLRALTKASFTAMLSAFPNVVHFHSIMEFVIDQDFIAILEGWSNLRTLIIRRSAKLKLTPSTLQMWKEQLLPKTRCRSYRFLECSDMNLNNYLKFVVELRAASTPFVKHWLVEYSTSPHYHHPFYAARPIDEDAEGRNVVVTMPNDWDRGAFHPVYKGKQLVLKPFSPAGSK